MQAEEWPEPAPDGGAPGAEATECREKDLIGNLCSPVTKENINVNSADNSCSLINQERSNTEQLADNIGVQSHVPTDRLPHGWLKEVRFRKGSKTKDPFYIELKTGYAFRSLKDVSRYIETGDIRRCASKPQIRSTSEMNAIEKQSHLEAVDNIPAGGAAVPTKPKKHGRGRKQSTTKTEPVTKELNLELNPKEAPQPKRHKKDHHSTPRKPKATKEPTAPVRASPRLAALRVSHALNLEPDDPPQAKSDAQKEESPQKESSEKLEINASVANQATTETTDKPASPLSSIFGSSWSDPCIEFAFKTLTGDIPDLGGDARSTDINCSTSAYDGSGMLKTSDKLYTGNELHRQVGNWGKS